MTTYTNDRGTAHVFDVVQDLFDGIPCYRVQGQGDVEALDRVFQVEHFANDEFTAWFEANDVSSEFLVNVGWAGTGPLSDQPCGCHACDDGVQSGHFACSQPSQVALDLERRGYIHRAYDDGCWQWV